MMKNIDLRDLLEAGCHFGHEARRWHPKASTFVYTNRGGTHIIDLAKTKDYLVKACEFVNKLGLDGKMLLYVGTKRQAKTVIRSDAESVNAGYFSQRWMGGFVTNWGEIKKNIEKLNKMDKEENKEEGDKLTKHERLQLKRIQIRLEKVYGGVKHLKALPDALFVVDIRKESTAISEGNKKGIPIVALVDTNSDPTTVDYPIPANDDAVKSITLITNIITAAYKEGLDQYNKTKAAVKKEEPEKKKTKATVKKETKPKKEKTNE